MAGSTAVPCASDVPTLYVGRGAVALRRLIDAFYDRVERDDHLSVLFPGGMSEDHRANVTLVGGGARRAGRLHRALGGYPRMLAHHRDLRITPDSGFASPRP